MQKTKVSLLLSFGQNLHLTSIRLKCDRASPCDTCVKRGLSLSCAYAQPNRFSKVTPKQPHLPSYASLQERITQLENLVANRLTNAEKTIGENDNIEDCPSFYTKPQVNRNESSISSSDKGRISVKQEGTTWVEGDHWSAILDGISELKDSLEPGNPGERDTEASDVQGPDILLGGQHQVQKHEIFAALPERPVADRMISQFIKSVEIAPMVVHIPTFLNEYEHFWNHQEQTPILWMGLLFGILCLAALHQQSGFEPPTNPPQNTPESAHLGRLAQRYRTKIAQCLVLGNYTKPARYSVEALLLYMHVEYVRSQDTQTGLWILLGITIRLALRMGYHRDGADFFPKISPFHAEIRRRVWTVIVMMDCGASQQFGLPKMLQTRQCSTAPPRHLLDEDLTEDMRELPPARPDSMATTVQYFVVKNRLIIENGHIAELKTLTKSPEYIEVLRLDGNLQSIYEGIPPTLMMRPMSKTILDSPSLIVHRVYVALLYFTSKCILHQIYLIPSWTNTFYKYSRTACIEAALEILHIQQILDQETQPGGRLYDDRGKVSSVVRSGFLVATTILCVDINHILSQKLSMDSQVNPDLGSNKKAIVALRGSHQVWLRSCNSSKEAQQAARAIEIVLAKATPETTEATTPSTTAWDGMTLVNATDTIEDQAFDDMLLAVNPILYAGLQSDAGEFPEFSGLDLEMASSPTLPSLFWVSAD